MNSPTRQFPAPVSKVRAAAIAAAVLLTVASTTARAQGVPDALNQVNGTLNALIATVSQLVAKVNQLISISTPAAGATSLVTSSARAVDQGVTCEVVNAGTTAAQVTITMINASGEVLGTSATPIGAGKSSYLFKPLAGSQTVHCRFDAAQAAQLRANLSMLDVNSVRTLFTIEAR